MSTWLLLEEQSELPRLDQIRSAHLLHHGMQFRKGVRLRAEHLVTPASQRVAIADLNESTFAGASSVAVSFVNFVL